MVKCGTRIRGVTIIDSEVSLPQCPAPSYGAGHFLAHYSLPLIRFNAPFGCLESEVAFDDFSPTIFV
jgi:hypothetical protein